MPTIILRLTGSREDADALIGLLRGLEDIEHVGSSTDPSAAPGQPATGAMQGLAAELDACVRLIEVRAGSPELAARVCRIAEVAAERLHADLDFGDSS